MISLTDIPRQKDRVLVQRAEDALVLLNIEEGNYYALNEVGGRIWELCEGKQSISEIISAVADEYSTPLEIVQADVLELLAELVNEKLLLLGGQAAG